MLRRARLSVEEIAAALGVTDNAVRAQLTLLERDGLVQAAGVRRDGAVGKPATLYEISPEAATLFSSAYAPLLAAVLAEVGEKLTAAELRALMKRAGHRLADGAGSSGTFDQRVRATAAVLAGLGADAELIATKDGYVIEGHGCPVAHAVQTCPETCRAIEQLLADASGAQVRERCDRSGVPNCRFAVVAGRG